jgi:hypothetical protein
MKKILFFTALSFLIFSCSKTHEGMTKATIKDYTGLDGCGMLIVLENGNEIEPSNLNSFSSSVSISDGQKVWVKYHEIGGASICMVGAIVQIDELEER